MSIKSVLGAHINRQTLVALYHFLKLIHTKFQSIFSFLTMSSSQSTDPIDQDQTESAPPFDPSQPSVPISYPIKTLEDLESRAYFHSFHYPFNISSVPLPQGPVCLPNRRRLLVCHDMEGGYLDDKWVQGGNNPDAYCLWHWYLIDVFVYFSHSLVTLPPPCWTNAAHKHGVKVLGTFITEWDEGRLACNKLLESKESARMYAERLAELAVALGFDGWLINMEIKLDLEQIPNLKEFVRHLTHIMHSLMPGSLVIWYDSVTVDGDLKWQDQLNEKNKPFFDICDGIFVNYTWKRDYPKLSASEAGDRKFDVYMGIDVFGRNTYGGGQWKTNVALDVIKDGDVSAAIFAPAWVYQTKQPPDFRTAQNHWWALVEKSWGRVNNYPKILPFYSSFDQGCGYHIAVEGEQVKDASWNNMSCQGLQPFLQFVDGPTEDTIQVCIDHKEASYNGGGNITFKGTLDHDAQFITKLFQGELLLDNLPLCITYSVKSEGTSLLSLSIQFASILNNERTSVLIASKNLEQLSCKFNKVIVPHQVRKSQKATGWIVYDSSITMNGHVLTEIHAVCYKTKPEQTEVRSKCDADNQDNALAPNPADYYAVLGDVAIINSKENSYLPSSTSWFVEGQYIKCSPIFQGYRTVSGKITWKLKVGRDFQFPKYNIFVEKLKEQVDCNRERGIEGPLEYLGVAHVEAFYVSDLSIPSDTSSLRFFIQACGFDGACQTLDNSPFFQVDLEG